MVTSFYFLVRNHRLNFRYSDPEPNFKHSAVRGLVCKLFRSKNPEYNIALETVAGGRVTYFYLFFFCLEFVPLQNTLKSILFSRSFTM